jgi:hypothetical protein
VASPGVFVGSVLIGRPFPVWCLVLLSMCDAAVDVRSPRFPPNKKPPGLSAQEVAGERDVAFAVR